MDYTYEITKVDVSANTMEVVYRAEGKPDVLVGMPLPEVGKLDERVAQYVPHGEWNPPQVDTSITVGQTGTQSLTQAVVQPAQQAVSVVVAEVSGWKMVQRNFPAEFVYQYNKFRAGSMRTLDDTTRAAFFADSLVHPTVSSDATRVFDFSQCQIGVRGLCALYDDAGKQMPTFDWATTVCYVWPDYFQEHTETHTAEAVYLTDTEFFCCVPSDPALPWVKKSLCNGEPLQGSGENHFIMLAKGSVMVDGSCITGPAIIKAGATFEPQGDIRAIEVWL